VVKNLIDDWLILAATDHPGFTATLGADRHIDKVNGCGASREATLGDVEYLFQMLRPGQCTYKLSALPNGWIMSPHRSARIFE
jgi:hypothetical protein